jgi:ribosomal protein S12 methylthiotransferase
LPPPNVPTPTAPKVGFVSLGCPKALTDSELILTQLSAEGYSTSKTFEGADLVIVNTCGFIDDAVKESLDTIGEALAEQRPRHRHRLPGRPGGRGRRQPGAPDASVVLAVTGPHATQEVMDRCTRTCPSRTIPSSTWCRPPASSSRRGTTPT